jgi:hypothetical protein
MSEVRCVGGWARCLVPVALPGAWGRCDWDRVGPRSRRRSRGPRASARGGTRGRRWQAETAVSEHCDTPESFLYTICPRLRTRLSSQPLPHPRVPYDPYRVWRDSCPAPARAGPANARRTVPPRVSIFRKARLDSSAAHRLVDGVDLLDRLLNLRELQKELCCCHHLRRLRLRRQVGFDGGRLRLVVRSLEGRAKQGQ